MDSEEAQLSSFRNPAEAHAHSQLCEDGQTDTATASGGGTSGPVGQIAPVDHEKNVKKEEPEDEDYPCKGTSSTLGDITSVDEQKHVIKEEPEDEGYHCEGASTSVGCMSTVDQQSGGFQSKHKKEEESAEEDYICTTTVCG
ncbi:hypothetical protein PGIGA_G00102800 [Pangasianodon gigas]|uniref:Uncharacterized protein n=1 Tax=Pangasianodon gigas TaxID=30993 RepID=A0ACC5XEV6_PANGG|nr:hypothetical protein [Pangasianodon gigas]